MRWRDKMKVELFLLVVSMILIMCVFMLLSRTLEPFFGVLEWITSIAALVLLLVWLVLVLVEKFLILDDQVHCYKARQRHRERVLSQRRRQLTVPPSRRKGP